MIALLHKQPNLCNSYKWNLIDLKNILDYTFRKKEEI